MTSKIKVYKDNPTSGDTDGTLVSSGDWSDPIHSGSIKVPDTGYEEGDWIKLAVRCDDGYETVEEDNKYITLSIKPHETSLDGSVSSGDSAITVHDVGNLDKDRDIIIAPSTADEETHRIASVSGSTLTLEDTLNNSHGDDTTVISASEEKWQLAPDDGAGNADEGNAEEWGSNKEITTQVNDTNYIFHIRARAEAGEEPQNNKTVQVKAQAIVGEK